MAFVHLKDLSNDTLVQACSTLAAGGLVVAPFDTVYGLVVDASNDQAVRKLLAFKQRPVGKPISICVASLEMMSKYVDVSLIPPSTRSLLPGAYTIVLASLHRASHLLEAEDGTLGVRWIGKDKSSVSDPPLAPADFMTTLVHMLGRPVTATSANLAGKPSCHSVEAFLHQLSNKKKGEIDVVIDGGILPPRAASTVISYASGAPRLLRAGDSGVGEAITSHSADETRKISALFIRSLAKTRDMSMPTFVLLDGVMGAGKTTFMQGLATELGIDRVVSPTYTYECEYDLAGSIGGWKKLRHYDLFNLDKPEDIATLQIHERATPDMLVCIEWPAQLLAQQTGESFKHTVVTLNYIEDSIRSIGISR